MTGCGLQGIGQQANRSHRTAWSNAQGRRVGIFCCIAFLLACATHPDIQHPQVLVSPSSHAQCDTRALLPCPADLSRYGTFVNGDKLASESKRQLQAGDSLKLAAKVHAR